MHGADGYQLGTLFFIEVVKIGLMLEEVGIQLLAFERHIGLHVVGIFDDLKFVTLRFQNVVGDLEDFRVRRRRGTRPRPEGRSGSFS